MQTNTRKRIEIHFAILAILAIKIPIYFAILDFCSSVLRFAILNFV